MTTPECVSEPRRGKGISDADSTGPRYDDCGVGEDAKQLAGRQREEEEVLLAAKAEAGAAEEAATVVLRPDRYTAATDRSSIGIITASSGCDE